MGAVGGEGGAEGGDGVIGQGLFGRRANGAEVREVWAVVDARFGVGGHGYC